MTTRFTTDCEGFHRRDFLKFGAGGLFGLGLADMLRLEANAKSQAGPSTIDMWDLKPNAPEGIRTEFKPIDTAAPGIQISEHLPKMAKVIDKTTIVRSLYHTIPSHGTATVWMTTGNKPTPAMAYPALGSIASKLMTAAPGMPKFVSFGEMRNGDAGTAGYLGTAYNPFIIDGSAGGGNLRVRGITLPNGFTVDELQNRDGLRDTFENTFRKLDKSSDMADGFDAFHKQALEILRSDRTKNAFDMSGEKDSLKESYGNNTFGQSALVARRLVESGVRFVTLTTGGWDTHGNNFQSLKSRLLPNIDTTLSALIKDLSDRGMLERTIVYCAGEFSRTPKINKNNGRDHWSRSMAVVLAGGGFKKGYAHGTTDAQGQAPATEPCTPDDVASTIFQQLGIDPHQELMTPSNRPMQLFREGKVVEKLLA
jgi:hypothetical protein